MKILFIPSCEIYRKDQIGPQTLMRLERGLQIWRTGDYDLIAVAGGIFNPAHIQTTPAGELMKSWLLEQGVPAAKIIAETNSRDTYENIQGVIELAPEDATYTVVTHWQHALRFWVTFRRAHGIKIHMKQMWKPWLGLMGTVMEFAILAIHIFDKNGSGCIARWNQRRRTFPKGG